MQFQKNRWKQKVKYFAFLFRSFFCLNYQLRIFYNDSNLVEFFFYSKLSFSSFTSLNALAQPNIPVLSNDARTWNIAAQTTTLKQVPPFAIWTFSDEIAADFTVASFEVPKPTSTTENARRWRLQSAFAFASFRINREVFCALNLALVAADALAVVIIPGLSFAAKFNHWTRTFAFVAVESLLFRTRQNETFWTFASARTFVKFQRPIASFLFFTLAFALLRIPELKIAAFLWFAFALAKIFIPKLANQARFWPADAATFQLVPFVRKFARHVFDALTATQRWTPDLIARTRILWRRANAVTDLLVKHQRQLAKLLRFEALAFWRVPSRAARTRCVRRFADAVACFAAPLQRFLARFFSCAFAAATFIIPNFSAWTSFFVPLTNTTATFWIKVFSFRTRRRWWQVFKKTFRNAIAGSLVEGVKIRTGSYSAFAFAVESVKNEVRITFWGDCKTTRQRKVSWKVLKVGINLQNVWMFSKVNELEI